jgi:hypothetical protein
MRTIVEGTLESTQLLRLDQRVATQPPRHSTLAKPCVPCELCSFSRTCGLSAATTENSQHVANVLSTALVGCFALIS